MVLASTVPKFAMQSTLLDPGHTEEIPSSVGSVGQLSEDALNTIPYTHNTGESGESSPVAERAALQDKRATSVLSVLQGLLLAKARAQPVVLP